MKISTLFLNSLNILHTDAQKRPNVILLLADDLGMGDISLNNKDGKIKTPNIGNHIFYIYIRFMVYSISYKKQLYNYLLPIMF